MSQTFSPAVQARDPPGGSTSIGMVLILTSILAIAGCKVRINVPEGGRVESESGAYSCEPEQTCDIDVFDSFFDETFRGEPYPGYRFIRWRKPEFGLCGGLTTHCRLSTAAFSGTPLINILQSDSVFYLDPDFGKRNTWRFRTNIPTPRIGFGVCAARGKLYAIGGYAMASAPGLRTVEEYDPATDAWRTRSPMPTGRRFLSVSSALGRCYAIGGDAGAGEPPLQIVEEYNPVTDRWRRRADLPQPKSAHASATLDGKIYAVGGAEIAVAPAFGPAVPTTFVYDPRTDEWASAAPMPVPLIMLATASAGGRFYALGGVPAGFTSAQATLQRYDPDTDSWAILPDMPTTRANHMAATVNGRIYVIGGREGFIGSTDGLPSSVYEFNPESGNWMTRAELLDPRVFLAGGTLGKTIFAVSGALGTVNTHPAVSAVTELIP